MGQYLGDKAAWIDNVYQFEETDVVQGGPDGVDNLPLKNLADRTAWLKDQLGILGESAIGGNTTITTDFSRKFITASANGVITLTLADAATFRAGSIIPITAFCAADSVVNIAAQAGQKIFNSAAGKDKMYMHDKEILWLMASAGGFKIVHAKGNFDCVGEEIKSRKKLTNTMSFEGQLLQRNFYPRLFFEYILSLTVGQEVVSEAQWFSDPYRYRGCFTLGNGASTFRMPDERGMFDRMLDLNRGVDLNRLHNYPGGYEKDAIVDHHHDIDPNPNANSNAGWGKITTGNDSAEGTLKILKSTGPKDSSGNLIGASETIVKNIGKYNSIKY